MRRLLPWALVGLLGILTAAAAAFGAAGAPNAASTTSATAAQWVAGVLSATARAGTANFSYVHVATSPNPDLRSAARGNGVVDFSRGNFRVTEVDHETEFSGGSGGPLRAVHFAVSAEEIAIGSVTYQRLSPFASSAVAASPHLPFLKHSVPRRPRAELGLSYALEASAALVGLDGSEQVVSVHDLGRVGVNRVATTEYRVVTAPFPACPSAPKVAPVVSQGPTLLWIDAQGRIVRVRSTSHVSGVLPSAARALPAFAGYPVGPVTSTDTLTFGGFGAPVHIAAPPPSALPLGERSSTGGAFAISTCSRN